MICVIEPQEKCVWGIGKTKDEAWDDANKQIDEFKSCNPHERMSFLDVATLRRGAPLHRSGQALWAWVAYAEHKQEQPKQGELGL